MRLQNAASLSQPGGIFRSTNSVIQGAANANHLLFSYMMRLLRRPNLRDAAVHQFEIANQAESIRDRMALMARLTAELKDRSDYQDGIAPALPVP